MRLLAAYVVIVLVVGFFGVELGFELDTLMPTLAIPIGLAIFFAVLIAGWPAAVFVTERWLIGAKAD